MHGNATSQTCPYKDCGTSGRHCVLYWEACQSDAGQCPYMACLGVCIGYIWVMLPIKHVTLEQCC